MRTRTRQGPRRSPPRRTYVRWGCVRLPPSSPGPWSPGPSSEPSPELSRVPSPEPSPELSRVPSPEPSPEPSPVLSAPVWSFGPPSWPASVQASCRETSPQHRRPGTGGSDQRSGCAWRRGCMVETDHSGPVPPDPHPRAARPGLHGFSLVSSSLLAPRKKPSAAKLAPYECGIVPRWSRRSDSPCASTWSP